MIPTKLRDWTYEVVAALCVAGQSESDRYDFKFNLAELHNAPKICCAFANTYGGFIVVGVKEAGPGFDPIGLDPDKELYAKFIAKVKVDPDIGVPPPLTIAVPGSSRLLYVFEVPQSPRRPHLPSPTDQRVFWKRQGSECVQMTLEEIRYQMNSYEEKREKLALLLIDLRSKLRSLQAQASMPDGKYNGDIFSFEIIDRVVVEAYALLKDSVDVFRKLETIKSGLMSMNAETQLMITAGLLPDTILRWRNTAKHVLPEVSGLIEQVERMLTEELGIVDPYKAST